MTGSGVSSMSYLAMALGAFYVFAGVVVMRATAADRLMDQVLAALGDPGAPKERMRSGVLRAGAFLTLASGVALAILSPLALPLFAINLAVQGGYLVWAGRALPPESGDDAKGRRRTKNAFVVYLAAAAFVGWLADQGLSRPWSAGAVAFGADALVVAAAMLGAWAFVHRPWAKAHDADRPLPDVAAPARLRLAPEYMCSPLWDADTGEPVSVFALDLPQDLADEIENWDDMFQSTYNEGNPAASGFADPQARDEYTAQGKVIALALRAALGRDLEVAEQFN